VKKKYILSIDQGTTGSREILFNHEGEAFATSYKEIEKDKSIFRQALRQEN
jgi:glycerol kinase